jgi:YidC/Oxa1 family membrane protein insertase
MRNNVFNLILFVFAATGLYFLWTYAEKHWLPQPPKDTRKEQAEEEAKKKADEQALRDAKIAAAGAIAGNAAVAFEPTKPVKHTEPPKIVPPRERGTLIALGDDTFYNKVLLSTEGGGIQQVVLTRFEQADRLGRQMKGVPLYLIPGVPRVRGKYLEDNYPVPDLKPGKVGPDTALAEPAYTIFHYPTPDDKYPDPKLGEMQWKVVAEERPEGGEHKVVFEAELGDPYFVRFRKTYKLGPKDYHVGLSIEIERLPGGEKGKGQLRYQLSGPRGEPIEGEWYNNTYRVALVGWLDRKGRPGRQYETSANVAIQRGGEAVQRGEYTFKYMGVTTQYFTSAAAVDDTAEGVAKNPWSFVRATTELPFGKNGDQSAPFFDDMTVRAASEIIDLAPGEKIEHKYLIYNGPSKVKLLGLMEGDRAVDANLVLRYQDKLGLKTLTDYQSPTWLGTFANAIYWTDLVIAFTNIMHWFMALIHTVIPSWALCIIVLTVMVRLLLHYPSKRQTRMNMRMMEVQKKLAPQFEELKKKYEGDFHGYNRAKMQLMLAHGINPLAQMGGCLLLFAQMPIMMGLYYCLQESVFFRLEPFLWINNLAAPDMTLWWGEHIPYVSGPDSLGAMYYLGPYLNILPILAIVLMFWQQLKMLPPPTDDQSRQQRTMMKMMMFIMPLFFYKFAAGLAMYFIIGTLWGLAERRLIKKAEDKGGSGGGALAELHPMGGSPNGQASDAPAKPKGMFGRLREAMQKRIDEMKRHADEQSKRQIRNDKNAPDQGSGQAPGPNPNRRDDRRDKKKKRRK